MKFKFLLFLTPLILLSSCSNDEYVEVPIKQRPLYTLSEWYGDDGNESDSLLVPIITELEFFLDNIQFLETNSETYRIEGLLNTIKPFTDDIIDSYGDTIFKAYDTEHELKVPYSLNENFFTVVPGEYIGLSDSDKELIYTSNTDSISQTILFFETTIFHDWNLSKYPFDKQKLKIIFEADADTALQRTRMTKLYTTSFEKKNDLKKGFEIEKIDFKEDFKTTPFYNFVRQRYDVKSQGIFEITVKRSGSWLFIKLFFGGILALVISWLVFIIPLRDFTSRIELSIGAVFAAVGNKYFVDSAIDSQVLTVADLFNNIIIFMVVLNVGLIIMKRNAVFKNKLINDTQTVSRISIYTALVLFGLLTIYTIT